jgi:hypothetical protein
LGFTIYAGWLTSATILNTSGMLKAWGLNETSLNIDESHWGVVILIVAACVYIAAGYMYGNPLYCLIYIWALFAIKDRSDDLNIETTTEVLLVVLGSYIIGLTVWLALDKINNSPNERYGLFY